jgi:hypothetical protein
MICKDHGMVRIAMAAALSTSLVLGGCASPRPVPYAGIVSSSKLHPNSGDKTGRVPFSYSPPVDWHHYRNILIEPVAIYSGPDNQFGKIPEEGRKQLASYMQEQFAEKMATVFDVVQKPGAETIRLQLTLTGAAATKPVLGTFSRFDLVGGPYNAVQSVRGREGTMTGSVLYAVEIFDASNGRLLRAFVTKQYPSPMNIKASFGPLRASMTGIRKGAEELAEQLGGH